MLSFALSQKHRKERRECRRQFCRADFSRVKIMNFIHYERFARKVSHLQGFGYVTPTEQGWLLQAPWEWVSVAAREQLPAWSAPFVCAARLVPFAKKAGKVLRRLCGKIL